MTLIGLTVVATMSLHAGETKKDDATWDRAAAARYLDARATLWTEWSRSRQKLDTACMSCHTAVPYLLSRAALSESAPADPANALYADVESRVEHWGNITVWYDESRGARKPEESWDTESVLNALVLTWRDARSGETLSASSRQALDRMWSRQNADGNWSWLHFDLGPWETDGSEYWGASLAAVAAMTAADQHPPPHDQLATLEAYLRAGLTRELKIHNALALLWASSVWKGLLSERETSTLVSSVAEHQRDDGGFRLVDLGPWVSKDGTPSGAESDGYATAFATFVSSQLDSERAAHVVTRGRSWLRQHQMADGRWETFSPNKDRRGEEDLRRLLASDAATGFAVLALTEP